MVAVEHRKTRFDVVPGAMRKGERALFMRQCGDCAVVGYATEHDDGAKIWKSVDSIHEELPAGLDFSGRRFVFGRYASDGIGDHRVRQCQSVIGPGLVSTCGEPKCQQSLKQQYACMIAGERAARAVGALQTGG